MKGAVQGVIALCVAAGLAVPAVAEPVVSFETFKAQFAEKAVAAGISPDVYREIMAGVQPVDNIPGLVTAQPEFTTPIWDYMARRASDSRIRNGRAAMARNRELFESIGRQTGVDPALLGAIWGIETNYGTVLDDSGLIRPIIPNLATLVHHRRSRLRQDEQELIAAMKLVQEYGWTAETLVGSWAGAIGHTQVIASGLLEYGTDGNDDGWINPHSTLADALATTATYLRALGYEPGVDWGYEVRLPDGFDYTLATRERMRPVSFFAERGVRRVLDREFTDMDQPVFLYVPAGSEGPKFLMTPNYLVLKRYNFSDSYALTLAHLTDRLKGTGPLAESWPTDTRFPDREQRFAIQQWLRALGHYNGEVDGMLGPVTQQAYQRFQQAQGMLPDGFITLESYEALRRARSSGN